MNINFMKRSKKDEVPEPQPMTTSEFIASANSFLDNGEDKMSSMLGLNKRQDTLRDMLNWAIRARGKNADLKNELNVQRSRLHRAEEYINKVEHILSNKEMEIASLHSTRERVARENAREKDEMKNQHTRRLADIEEKQSMDRALMESKHDAEVATLKQKHHEEKNVLLQQLMHSGRDDQGWPDDKMRLKFRELQRLMESVTAPRNKEFLIPAGQHLPSHLDTTGFLGRAGNGKSHFLLKGTLWSIIGEQYFSAPFGFGIFGPGRSQKQLFDMYAAWRKLFDPSSVASKTFNPFFSAICC